MSEFALLASFVLMLAVLFGVIGSDEPTSSMYTDLYECELEHPESLCVIRYVPIETEGYDN